MKLQESSLSRLYQHNVNYDCGALTAFRTAAACGTGTPYTREDNRRRNRSLLAKLQVMGYSVTRITGRYPEGGTVTTEESFFVVDHKQTGDLEKNLRRLGELFEQDSILFIPKGAIVQQARAYLIGTNHCENNWIGYGKTQPFAVGKLGRVSPIYTSYVKGRPFIFEDVDHECVPPASGFGWWGLHLAAQKHWTQL